MIFMVGAVGGEKVRSAIGSVAVLGTDRYGLRVFLRRGAMRHPLGAPLEGAPPLDPALTVPEAVDRLTDAVRRFTAHRATHAQHPAYGSCTHEEYAALHAMHLAEHLPGLATP
jgi:hypothetical protein